MRRVVLLCAALTALIACTPAQAQTWGDRPAVDDFRAVDVSTTTAKFRADVHYNELLGTWWFSYCVAAPSGGCADEPIETPHQSEIPDSNQAALAAKRIEWQVSGLRPATNYLVTVHVENDTYAGDPTHKEQGFTTAQPFIPVTPVVPRSTTDVATNISYTSLTLNGSAVPGTLNGNGIHSTAFFEYGIGGNLTQRTADQDLPADGNPYPISAGLASLADDTEYRFRLVVVRNGARFEGAIRSVHTLDAPNCAGGWGYGSVTRGRIVAVGCNKRDGTKYVFDGDVRLNGMLLHPDGAAHTTAYRLGSPLQADLDAANRFYLDVPGRAIGTTGDYTLSARDIPNLAHQRFSFSNVDFNGTASLARIGTTDEAMLFQFPFAAGLYMTPRADGTMQLKGLVSLPLPGAEQVTGEAAVRVNPSGDLALDRIKVEVAVLPLGNFELGNLKFVYDRTENQWEGAAEVQLPTASRVTIAAAVIVKNGQFGEFTGSVDNINQHIAYGVYLQKVGVTIGVQPNIKFGGTIGISAGPVFEGVGIFRVDGGFEMQLAGGRVPVSVGDTNTVVDFPGSITISGEGYVAGVHVNSTKATWYFSQTPWFDVSTTLGFRAQWLGINVFSATGTFSGGLYGSQFELGAQLSARIGEFDVVGADLVATRRGIAGCGRVTGVGGVGAYMPWGSRVTTVGFCDMAELKSRLARASAAGALSLPDGDRALVRFMGSGGAPQVRLHGPGGRVIDTPARGTITAKQDGVYAIVRDDVHGWVDVLLTNPGSGWSYDVLAGSVGDVKTAGELPALNLRASVRRVGSRAVLSWNAGDLAGRKVTFMESTPGAPLRKLATTGASSGSVRFTPLLTPERTRRIVATVELGHLPLSRSIVARYEAPAMGRVVPVRGLRAVVRGGKVRASWKGMAAASRFRVIAADRSGARVLRTVKKPAAALPKTTRSVTVIPVGWDGKKAAARTVRVK